MNRERLEHLITVLQDVSRKRRRLNMGTWKCGTAACAAGWAALDPAFNAQGLTLTNNYFPAYKEHDCWRAVEKFFDLSQDEAEHIFYEGAYTMDDEIRPRHVIARVRALLAKEIA